jgi:cell division protein FtsB
MEPEVAAGALEQYGPLGATVLALLGLVVWLVKVVVSGRAELIQVIKDNSAINQKLADILDNLATDNKDEHKQLKDLTQKTYNAIISRQP